MEKNYQNLQSEKQIDKSKTVNKDNKINNSQYIGRDGKIDNSNKIINFTANINNISIIQIKESDIPKEIKSQVLQNLKSKNDTQDGIIIKESLERENIVSIKENSSNKIDILEKYTKENIKENSNFQESKNNQKIRLLRLKGDLFNLSEQNIYKSFLDEIDKYLVDENFRNKKIEEINSFEREILKKFEETLNE
jgi:hypothetical protein